MNSNNLNSKYKNLIKSKFILFSSFLFLLYFFSNNLIYAQSNQKSEPDYLIPIGNVLQIDAELKNIIVRNYIEDSPFTLGDAILSINNTPISSYNDFSEILCSLDNKEDVSVLVSRGTNKLTIHTNKEHLEKINFNNLLSGFATLTYINPDTQEFAAVGHPISIGTSRKIPIKNGCISTTTDLDIQKSSKGNVGCINAKRNSTIGQFTQNTDFGIKGNIVDFDTSNLKKYKVADLKDIKLGKAQLILQNNSLQCEKYDIQIVNVENQRSAQSKTIKFKIIDKDLLLRTGGVVQGMSGTPIVQGNKIIGAVSHAVENDPTLGYGIFIKWMIEEK
ncbi:SpoIVB peptidase S55 domain-containing protein [Clostridium sp. CCUG 7971]|uniref:SpoIVB peptidase S55 domain-containing protein n=1 Tax=Clostridium sp. CCUG 7971 TaxID=2811414 RepID=UPI001ABAA81A|nr:SpoIVB peptidase S55 domain-containing protein [Clostridium sp. CCUG 7971]MBO3446490.1 peptidase S55 [Clostridium sp. CCUG 7971]